MIVLVASSALVSVMLAWGWAKSRGWLGFVKSTLAVWAAISALPLFAPVSQISTFPGVREQILPDSDLRRPVRNSPDGFSGSIGGQGREDENHPNRKRCRVIPGRAASVL